MPMIQPIPADGKSPPIRLREKPIKNCLPGLLASSTVMVQGFGCCWSPAIGFRIAPRDRNQTLQISENKAVHLSGRTDVYLNPTKAPAAR